MDTYAILEMQCPLWTGSFNIMINYWTPRGSETLLGSNHISIILTATLHSINRTKNYMVHAINCYTVVTKALCLFIYNCNIQY